MDTYCKYLILIFIFMHHLNCATVLFLFFCLLGFVTCLFFSILPFFYQSKWGERVRTTLLADVLAVESLHKTEICTGSGQSHDQIKSSQVSSREPIHSHHKNGSVFVFSVRQSVVGHLARLRHWDIPPVHKSPSHLSLFFLLNSASLVVSLSVSWCIMWDLFPNILLRNVLCVFLFWGGIYSPLRRVMYTEVFYILTLGNRVFSDIFQPGLCLIHISIHRLLQKHFHTHLQQNKEISWGETFGSNVLKCEIVLILLSVFSL